MAKEIASFEFKTKNKELLWIKNTIVAKICVSWLSSSLVTMSRSMSMITREETINLEKLRLPAKIRAIEKFQSRVSLWTYVGWLI